MLVECPTGMRDSIYFHIANIKGELVFHKTAFPKLRIKIKKEIRYYLWNFILLKKQRNVDFVIHFVDDESVEYALKRMNKQYFFKLFSRGFGRNLETNYSISVVNFQLLLRAVFEEILVIKGGFTLHSSASLVNGKAYIFVGPSGSGKTTIINLLRRKYPPLMDDIGVLKKDGSEYFYYQTPFIEKEAKIKKFSNRYPIARICFLKKAPYVKFVRITNESYILEKLLKQINFQRKTLSKKTKILLDFISKFEEFDKLYFNTNVQELTNKFSLLKQG